MAERVEWGIDIDLDKLRADAREADKEVARLTKTSSDLSAKFDATGQSSKKLATEIKNNNNRLETARNKQKSLNNALTRYNATIAKASATTQTFSTGLSAASASAGRLGASLNGVLGSLNGVFALLRSNPAIALIAGLAVPLFQAVQGLSQTAEGLRLVDSALIPVRTSWDAFIGAIQDNFRGDNTRIFDFFRSLDAFIQGAIQNVAIGVQFTFEKLWTQVRVFAQNTFTRIIIFFETKWLKALQTQNRVFGTFKGQIDELRLSIEALEGNLLNVNEEIGKIAERQPELNDLNQLWEDIGGNAGKVSRELINVNAQLRELRRTDDQAIAVLDTQIAQQRVILENRQLDDQTRRDAGRLAIQLSQERINLQKAELDLQIRQLELQISTSATSQKELEQIDQLRASLEALNGAQENFVRRIQSTLNSLPLTALDDTLKSVGLDLADSSGQILQTIVSTDEDIVRSTLNRNAAIIKSDKQTAETNEKIQEQNIAFRRKIAESLGGISASIFGADSKLTKSLILLAQAEGLAKNTASTPFPFNLLNIAAFVAQFAQVLGLFDRAERSFEKGGIIPIGGKRHSQGGTQFFGSDGTRFEAEKDEAVILNRGATKALMPFFSQLNQMHGGVNLMTTHSAYLRNGGIVQGINSNDQIDRLADRIVSGVAQIRPVVSVEDINYQSQRVNVIEQNSRL